MQRSSSSKKKRLLIVGAGPVGLAAALFVSSNPQIQVRIIEKNPNPREMIGSKALLINPRTMTLFQGFKVQKKLLQASLKIQKMQIYNLEKQKLMIENDLTQTLSAISKYPRLYLYPQCYTETFLEQAINDIGINVERGVELQKLYNCDTGVSVKLNNSTVQQIYDYVLAADGAHSKIRKSLEIPFPGETLQEHLFVADYINLGEPLQTGKFYLGQTDLIILFPVKDNIIRVVANHSEFMKKAKNILKFGDCVWKSNFKLNNRFVQKMNVGNIYLAGDAAHVHAPIGGRGMNLGIEDVFVFSHLLKDNRLHEYNDLRQPVVKNFVQKIMKASIILKREKTFWKRLFPFVARLAAYFGQTKGTLFVTGLDHDIPYLPKL